MWRHGGALVLAGILERQADELKEAYAPLVRLEVGDSEDGWILMTATGGLVRRTPCACTARRKVPTIVAHESRHPLPHL